MCGFGSKFKPVKEKKKPVNLKINSKNTEKKDRRKIDINV